jgi:hypothetical protein
MNGPVRGTPYAPLPNQEFTLMFANAFKDPDDNYWWKETISNQTVNFRASGVGGIAGVPNGGVHLEILSVPVGGEVQTKLRIIANDRWGDSIEQ